MTGCGHWGVLFRGLEMFHFSLWMAVMPLRPLCICVSSSTPETCALLCGYTGLETMSPPPSPAGHPRCPLRSGWIGDRHSPPIGWSLWGSLPEREIRVEAVSQGNQSAEALDLSPKWESQGHRPGAGELREVTAGLAVLPGSARGTSCVVTGPGVALCVPSPGTRAGL